MNDNQKWVLSGKRFEYSGKEMGGGGRSDEGRKKEEDDWTMWLCTSVTIYLCL